MPPRTLSRAEPGRDLMRIAVLLLLAAPLAGCVSPQPPATPLQEHVLGALRPSELVAGRFYAFRHDGGDIEISIDGKPAIFDLYAADDRRLGRFLVEEDGSSVAFKGLGPGEPVLVAFQLNGTLQVMSGGRVVTSFSELMPHRERMALVNTEGSFDLGFFPEPVPDIGSGPLTQADDVNILLLRAPFEVDVIGRGRTSGLHVTLSSDIGPVFDARHEFSGGGLRLQPEPLSSMAGNFYGQNVRNGTLAAQLRADSFNGVLLLSATSFSRAQPPQPMGARIQAEALAYNWTSKLDAVPDKIQLHPEATLLGFSMADPPATASLLPRRLAAQLSANLRVSDGETEPEFAGVVVVWDPDDRKVATLPVPVHGFVVMPVSRGGDYVVWSAVGAIKAWSDRAPADFQMNPLSTQELVVGMTPASFGLGPGLGASYDDATEPVSGPGPVYSVVSEPAPMSTTPTGLLGCQPRPLARLVQNNETLGAWGGEDNVDSDDLDATLRLAEGPLLFKHDGFGDDSCGGTMLRLMSYVRPAS